MKWGLGVTPIPIFYYIKKIKLYNIYVNKRK